MNKLHKKEKMNKKDLRIVFMGTPGFAVESLKALVENNYNVVGVITAPDKPAGRGYKFQPSAVKEYALSAGLPVLQPENLKNEIFLNELRRLEADIQVVVAFRMLPEAVWTMPPLGTFNLHASLLPQYRGAAPIKRDHILSQARNRYRRDHFSGKDSHWGGRQCRNRARHPDGSGLTFGFKNRGCGY